MNAVELYHRHSIEELVRMAEAIRRDPTSHGDGRPYLYTPAALRRLDEIGWAIHYHQQDQSRQRCRGASSHLLEV